MKVRVSAGTVRVSVTSAGRMNAMRRHNTFSCESECERYCKAWGGKVSVTPARCVFESYWEGTARRPPTRECAAVSEK